MGEFEEKLNSILSSPKDMEKILGLARELSGSMGESQEHNEPSGGSAPSAGLPDIDPKLFKVITRLMGEYKSSSSPGKTAILSSIKPYIKEERRTALDRAVKIARITHMARTAFSELGGDLDFGL